VGGVIIKRAIADTYRDRVFPGGLTYSGHPLACASIVASIGIFKEEKIVENARRLGTDVIGPALNTIMARHPSVGEVRGLGVFWAIELVRDRKSRKPLVPFNASGADAKPMGELMGACKAGGVWPFAHFNRLQVTPPCTTTADEAREGLAAIDKALEVADKYYEG
jgi:taurine--2-oxoglutarate transaminase